MRLLQQWTRLNTKIIKQICFIWEWGRGEGDFFFGLAIYWANIFYRDLTVYNRRHRKQEALWRESSPTTYIIVSCWQHHNVPNCPKCPWLGCLLMHAVSPPDIWSQCRKCRHWNWLKRLYIYRLWVEYRWLARR
jgi:hypothetical protein